MSLEQAQGYIQSESFLESFISLYEDRSITQEELDILNELKRRYEQEHRDIVFSSELEREELSYTLERTQYVGEEESINTPGFSDQSEVFTAIRSNPIYQSYAQEFQSLSQDHRKAIQTASIENPGRGDIDGIFGLQTLTAFRKSRLFQERDMTLSEVVGYYESIKTEFNRLSLQLRRNFQRPGGQDGIYGPNTFGYIIQEGKDLEILGVEVQTALELIESGNQEALPDISHFVEAPTPVFNNGLEMTDEDFAIAKQEARENGENPSFDEFRQIARTLSREQREQFQRSVNAQVDGDLGIGSYTHYLHSPLYEAGFTVQEIASFKRITEEDTQGQISQINEAFGIDLHELPLSIQAGDLVSYEPNYGVLKVVNHETGDFEEIDVADGIFDTISLALGDNGNPIDEELIFGTVDQLRGNSQLQREYIDALTSYVQENEKYEAMRAIFCVGGAEEQQTGTLYTVDFRGNRTLSSILTASDIFGDIPYLQTNTTTFINRQVPERNFLTFNGASRLSIHSGSNILIPNQEHEAIIRAQMESLEREQEIREAIENNLGETIQNENKTAILDYLELNTISQSQKESTIRTLQEVVFQERLFPHMRSMFTTSSEEGVYTFSPNNDLLGAHLTAFDIFGDYTTLESDGIVYQSITEKHYRNNSQRLALIAGVTTVSIQQDSIRSQEDYERVDEYPALARDFGNWVTRQRLSGIRNDCGGAVGQLLTDFGMTNFRRERGNMFSRLQSQRGDPNRNGYAYEGVLDQLAAEGLFRVENVDHPREARPGAIVVFRRNATSPHASQARIHAGHVEIKGSDNRYYSYYSSPVEAGSARSNSRNPAQYQRETGFIGKVYYPVRRG